MDVKHQRVYEFDLYMTAELRLVDELNAILAEGFEVTDLVPVLLESGGGIFAGAHGLYVNRVMALLSPSKQRSTLGYRVIKTDRDCFNKLNEALSSENDKGYQAHKIIPLTGIRDQESGGNMGRGTYGFAVFFEMNI